MATHRLLAAVRAYGAEIGLGAALVLFALLRTYALHFVRADEHMYNYMSLLVLDGAWPYRDFFLSHPPGHVYLMAAVFAVTGYSLTVAKWITTLAAGIAAVFVLLTGKRLFGKPEGLCAALLFLITAQVLDGSADITGANVTVVLMAGGLYFAVSSRHVVAGVLLGLACSSGVYAAPMALMLAVLLLWRSPRAALRCAAATAATLVLLSLPFLWVAGGAFWYQVVTYNLLKQAHPTTWSAALSTFFFFNQWPMIGFVSALALSGLRWAVEGRPRSAVATGAPRWRRLVEQIDPWRGDYASATILLGTLVVGYLAFYASLQVFYSYYFLMILPLLSLLTAYAAVDLARYAWQALVAKDAGGSRGAALGPRLVAIFAFVATIVHHGQIRDARLTDSKTEVLHFSWQDSPWLGAALNGWIRDAFWESTRDRKEPPGPITRYLQDESQFARTADDFVRAVREHCQPGDRIFGDYYLAPYAASLSDCQVAAHLVDTNTHRIKAGESTLDDWLRAATEDGLSLVVVRYPGWMTRQPAVRDGLLERFSTVVFTWQDPHVGRVELRRAVATAGANHRILE